jgi:hypothetical protein
MCQEINHDRRRFLRNAAMTIAAAELAMIGSLHAESSKAKPADARPIRPGTHTSFASSSRSMPASSIGYAEVGPAEGRAVVLLHGWPYDIHSYVDVALCWRPPAIG